MKTNATEQEINKAIETINKKYEDNIIIRDFKPLSSKRNQFTIKVKDSKKAGHRTSTNMVNKDGNYKKLPCACWHVHGDLFDSLFDINENIYIISGNKKITKDEGNWKDRNIGSIMYPMNFSQACDC